MKENQLQVLSHAPIGERQIPMYGTIEEPLFKASDVAALLEHSDVSMMIQGVDEDEKLRQTMLVSGQNRNVWFLKEQGLYEVLFLSRKPIAREFKKCVKILLSELRKGNAKVEPVKKPSNPVRRQLSSKMVRAYYAAIEEKKRLLNLSDASVARMVNKTDEVLGIEGQLIDYVPSQGILKPITELLKKYNVAMSAVQANKRLAELGILEQHTRNTRKGIKHFWALSSTGLEYGQNAVNPNNEKETQPLYYEDKFNNLIKMI